jgi:excisionase family DNA binding protein
MIEDLRAQGETERAHALETVVEVATYALTGQWPKKPRAYMTTAQTAKALGRGRGGVKDLIASGDLEAVQLGGHTLIRRESLLAYLDRLRENALPQPVRTPEEIEAGRRFHEWIIAGLPADKVARLEALQDKIEDGHRLSRAERSEMTSLMREVTAASAERVKQWIREFGRPQP